MEQSSLQPESLAILLRPLAKNKLLLLLPEAVAVCSGLDVALRQLSGVIAGILPLSVVIFDLGPESSGDSVRYEIFSVATLAVFSGCFCNLSQGSTWAEDVVPSNELSISC
jgi:hypothetical protein